MPPPASSECGLLRFILEILKFCLFTKAILGRGQETLKLAFILFYVVAAWRLYGSRFRFSSATSSRPHAHARNRRVRVMSSEEGVRRRFVSGGDVTCFKCNRGIGGGEWVDSTAPNADRSLKWRNKSCYPSCEEALRNAGRPPPNPPPGPSTATFPNQFPTAVCYKCTCNIDVGGMMQAVACPGEFPKWQKKKHCPSCPPGGNLSRVASEFGGGGGG